MAKCETCKGSGTDVPTVNVIHTDRVNWTVKWNHATRTHSVVYLGKNEQVDIPADSYEEASRIWQILSETN